jgi:hypothetical protein
MVRQGYRDGDKYFQSTTPDLNALTGAVVGGPAHDDSFQDARYVSQSEPTTYTNTPFAATFRFISILSISWGVFLMQFCVFIFIFYDVVLLLCSRIYKLIDERVYWRCIVGVK